MEGFNPASPHELREGAVRIQQLFARPAERQDVRNPAPCTDTPKRSHTAPTNGVAKVVVNAPLDFELQTLDYAHPYLRDRGFTDETIKHFGLGYCNRGMLKHRIAIPIHDAKGQLVGYAGRLANDRLISDENPKYRFPGDRERDGVRYEFRKSEVVYNINRMPQRLSDLIVVEGFASVWWLHKQGYRNVVATMGATCSAVQTRQITERIDLDGRVWLLFDGDEAGRIGAAATASSLARQRWTRCVTLPHGNQPTDSAADDLAAVLSL